MKGRNFLSKWRNKYLRNLEGKVLEIGVGTGKNFEYYGPKADVTAIDFSDGMLRKAEEENNRLGGRYRVVKMDAQRLEFKDNGFDYVITTFVLCSVPNPIRILKNMRRVVKKNGMVINMEHVLSQNWLIASLQRSRNFIMTRCFGSICINRDTVANIRKAGLKIKREENIGFMDVFKLIVSVK